MFDKFEKLNIDTCSDSELRTLIRQTLPIVMTFVKACQRFLTEDKPTPKPCDNCDKYGTCTETCELLETHLPGEYAGSSILSNTCGDLLNQVAVANEPGDNSLPHDNFSSLRLREVPKPNTILNMYLNCEHIFTPKQLKVIYMRYKEGMTIAEIATKLNLGISTIGDRLRRAKKHMTEYYETLRKSNFQTRNFT